MQGAARVVLETDWFIVLSRNPGSDCGVLRGGNTRRFVRRQKVGVCAREETQRHVGDHHRRRRRTELRGCQWGRRQRLEVAGMVVGGEWD